ncbi:hypothetical protein ACHAXM_005130 [Skeletonema potamos]
MRMIRLKKQPTPPPSTSPHEEEEEEIRDSNSLPTLYIDTTTTPIKNTRKPPILIPKSPISGISSLSRLAISCSSGGGRGRSSLTNDQLLEDFDEPPTFEIVNDDEELGSMQILLSPTHHHHRGGSGCGGGAAAFNNCNVTPSSIVASCSTSGGGRMSKLFKKSSSTSGGGGGKSGGGGNEGNNNHNNNSNEGGSNNSNAGSGGNGDSNDDKEGKDNNNNNNNNNNHRTNSNNDKGKGKDKEDVSQDEDDEEDDNNNNKNVPNKQHHSSTSSSNNNNNPTCPSSTTIFNKSRIEFAQVSTLPIHIGSESTAPTSHPSWTPVDGTHFKVRTGPNYPKNGQKIVSQPSLYEVYAVRYFQSEKRTVGGATRIMPLPEMTPPRRRSTTTTTTTSGMDEKEQIMMMDNSTVLRGNPFKPLASTTRSSGVAADLEGLNEISNVATTTAAAAAAAAASATGMMAPGGNKSHPELKGTKIPDVLVVHFMLPYEPPNMFKQKDDGRGGECVYYLRPSQRFLDEISGKIPETPATKLFVRWCNECESDFKMRSRFKCMALVRDIEKHNMGLLKSYNGKPVLITESGRAGSGYHGDIRYLEMTANVHYWAFMAKKGFVSLIPKFKMMQMEVGFTIEAHTDSEMPECMLGSTVLSYISESTGPLISEEMQEPVHEHQA